MKKFLVLGLILAVAGGAFAQITFSGSINTGIGVVIPDRNISTDPAIRFQRDAFGARPLQVDLNATATNSDGTASVHFGFRSTGAGFDLLAGNVRFNFLDNTLQLIAGRSGPGGFGTGAPRGQDFDLATGDTGHFSVVFNATPELRFGLTIRPGHGGANVLLKNIPITAGVRYAIPNVGSINLNFRFNEGASIVPSGSIAFPFNNRIDVAIGANLAPLVDGTGLTRLAFSFAAIDLTKKRIIQGATGQAVTGAGNAMETITLEFSEGLTYVADALTIGADLRQTIGLRTGQSMAMNLHFRLFGSYRVNDIITPGIDIGFVMGNDARNPSSHTDPAAVTYGGMYQRPADALGQAAVGPLTDRMGVAVNPYVNFAVGPAITMQLGYTFARNLKGASFMTNAVYFNVGMSF